eukprot:GHVT01088497.1.p1 GENE.GHVT01088497.1~~GHVT01088497.1.p1  ORF type:complete len:625 (+),score=71.35 GHVT01088497.1:616-2490(+)
MLTGGEQAAPPLQNGAGDTRGIHPDSHSGIVPSNEWDDKSSEHENPSRRLQSQHAAAAKMEFPTSYVPVNIMRSTIPPQSHPVDPAAMAAARKCAIEHLRHRRSGFAGEANEDDLPTPDDVSQEENGDSTDDFNYFSDSRRSIERTAFILQRTDPIAQHYDIGRTIGRGTWGEVKAVYHRLTGAKRAAKKIPKFYVEDVERFRQEITIMKSLDHPNIVRLHEAFEDDMDIYLVMEFCAGGELFDKLVSQGLFMETHVCTLMRQIMSSILYCHSRSVAHRDMKPENFLFLQSKPDSPIKLIDFGLASRFTENTYMTTRAGTPYYVSPQVLEGQYGPDCDVWSIGVMMYILLCGYPPFNAPSDRGIMSKVMSAPITFPDSEWKSVSTEAKDLIMKLLDRNVKTRLTAEQAMRHPWFVMYAASSVSKPLGIDILSKFKRFQGLSRLKKLALTIIAQNSDDHDIENLKEAFTQLDLKGDGVLTVDEIRRGILNSGFRVPNDLALGEILRDIDTAGTGAIDYTEFLAACLHQSHYIREEACRAAFRVLDINGAGRVSADELRHVFEMAGDETADVAAELLEADLDGDGEINFAEFCGLMRRVPSLCLIHEPTVSMMRKNASRTSLNQHV